MALTQEDLSSITAIVRGAMQTTGVLTTAEAIAYTKHESDSAFYRWCKRWSVRSTSNGRYSRARLDAAIARECRSTRMVHRSAA